MKGLIKIERLQKVIASSGYTSRRNAEELIKKGKVMVNGNTITEMGYKVSNTDIITVEGNNISKEEKKEYYLLNKPRGVITSVKDDKNRKTVVDLIDTNLRIYPVGRLDYDTTGALILTNDGELANLLMHPKSNVDKVYVAKIKGLINSSDLKKLESGVVINGIKTARAKAKIKKYDKKEMTSIVELSIHEGRNHQVKDMFKSLGFEVLKLKREKYCFLDLNGLKSGEYRLLTIKEVKKLYSYVNNHN